MIFLNFYSFVLIKSKIFFYNIIFLKSVCFFGINCAKEFKKLKNKNKNKKIIKNNF